LSASAKAMRVALHYPDVSVSFNQLHQTAKRATPEMYSKYKLGLILCRTFNDEIPENKWLLLNFDQINTSRQTKFYIRKTNNFLVGMNVLTNRFQELNGLLPLEFFNNFLTRSKFHAN
jgi:hypothetical protein